MSGRADLSEKELHSFDAFRRVARKVRESTPIEEGQEIQVRYPLVEDRITGLKIPRFDSPRIELIAEEPFEAMIPAIRQAYMKGEAANFYHIHNLLARYADPPIPEKAAELRAEWSKTVRQTVTMGKDGQLTMRTKAWIFDVWLNSDYLHQDFDKREEAEKLRESGELAQVDVQTVALKLAGRIMDMDDLVADFLGEERLPRIEPE